MDKSAIILWLKFAALLALFTYATLRVAGRERRRKHSPLGTLGNKGPAFRLVLCGVLVIGASIAFYFTGDAIMTGRLRIPPPNYTTGSGYDLYHSEQTNGFWMLVCIYCCFGLLFLYLSVAELIFTVQRNKRVRRSPSA